MTTTEALAELARRFDADRRHLRSVAFQLLGSAADADDVVQSAWLKASASDFAAVDNLTAWFTTITARAALDQLRARKRQAEWPLVDAEGVDQLVDQLASAGADEDALLADAVGRALAVVLDRLSPAQRVAFVLHDAFALPFEAIADLLDRSPAAAKKLASRARGQLHAGPAPQTPRTAEHTSLVEAFLAASRGGDIATLLELLAPDVVRRVEPAALVPADVPTELRGATDVAEETRQFAQRTRAGVVLLIDGNPGIVIAPAGRARILLRIGFGADDRIRSIDITGDDRQLRRAVLALPVCGFQEYHSPVWYQGHHAKLAGTDQDLEHRVR